MDSHMNDAESQTPRTQVLIVGAGPTGLVLALWLTKLGISVRIIDKTAGAAPFSRALAVHARTLEFYRQLGIADDVVGQGIKVRAANLWVRAARAARVPFAQIGEGLTPFPFVLEVAQDVHERLLIEQLGALGVTVERRTELLVFEESPNGMRATLGRSDGSAEICEATYLAGCDGAHSTVREGLSIGFPGGTYTHVFYVADVEADGASVDDEVHVDLDVADLLAVFPMRDTGRVRLVGTVRDEPGRCGGDLTFDDVRSRPTEQLKLAIKKVNWFSTYRVHHRVVTSFRRGCVFLVGDAAHIHSPVGGQGMNTGIGDSVNLAWKLAAVLNGSAKDDLLDSYEQERIVFARRLVATTDRIFDVASSPGPVAAYLRTRIAPRLVPLLIRLSAVRRFLFRTVSQIGISYRHSALSVGSSGAIRGGDRLPWVERVQSDAGFIDNFSPLTSLHWQVHVYGEPLSGLRERCTELGLPLQMFAWTPGMKRAGLVNGGLYLVRPDGYVALADAGSDPERLSQYITTRGLAPASN